MVGPMHTSPSAHRRGLLAGLLVLIASVSGAVAIAAGGTAPTTTAAPAAAAPTAAAPNAITDDGDRGTRGGRRANIADGDGDGRR
jgi:hypothetical protein